MKPLANIVESVTAGDGTVSQPDVSATEGASLLNDVATFARRYLAFPSEDELVAVVLWVAHTHALDCFDSTPRLALLSPEPGSGKTRVLEVIELLVLSPIRVLSASPAAIFRSITKARRTLLHDEVDALFARRGSTDDPNADMRALLNEGHRRGATIPRCVGPRHDVEDFQVFAAVALAGLGGLPDTLMDRCVIIRMQRHAPGEHVEKFRRRRVEAEGRNLHDRLVGWAERVSDQLAYADPMMPEGVTDRAEDCWEALLAIADAAGGEWPARARRACIALCKVRETREASLGVRLLTDVRIVYADDDRLSTEDLLARLNTLEEAPWGDLHGKALEARRLARLLKPYDVHSTKVRIGTSSVRGYTRESFHDPWCRYLPAVSEEAEHAEQPERTRSPAATGPTDAPRVRTPRG